MPLQLSRFSVKIQIAAIGACAVAGVVAIGGIYANGQASMTQFKASQVDAYELRKLATGMNVELLECVAPKRTSSCGRRNVTPNVTGEAPALGG
jgi:hypothetical protein